MHLVHVVGTISLESSGPSQSVPALCTALAQLGHETELLYLDYGGRPEVAGVRTRAYARTRVPGLRFAAWSASLFADLARMTRPDTIIHAHGLWHFPTIYPGWVHALRRTPLVISPRGTLARWPLEQSRVRKNVSLALGQHYALRKAGFLHATSDEEANDIRRFGLTNDIVVTPNCMSPAPAPSSPVERDDAHVLFMSRLHPKKQVEVLLRAWPAIRAKRPDARLTIAGPSEGGYRERLEAEARTLGLQGVHFVGELRGEAKTEALARASVFAFPTRDENFGMVVAEALQAGLLVVCSVNAPWSVLEERGFGRWVDDSPERFSDAIVDVLGWSAAKQASARDAGRAYAAKEFSGKVALPLVDAYRKLLDRA
jgi:glycosyltransferase involved in cell wall biosynthesis